MKTNIGIAERDTQLIAEELSKLLADEHVLYIKTRNAHWNVEGPDFYSFHIFFEKQYNELAEYIDEIAERIRMIGHYAPATLSDFLQLTHLTENSRETNDSKGFLRLLLTDHEAIIIHLRENIDRFANELKDAGTSDFFTGLMEKHEKMAWFIRSHLK